MKEFLYILIVTFSGTDSGTGMTTSIEMKFDGFDTLDTCYKAGMLVASEVHSQSGKLDALDWYCKDTSLTATR